MFVLVGIGRCAHAEASYDPVVQRLTAPVLINKRSHGLADTLEDFFDQVVSQANAENLSGRPLPSLPEWDEFHTRAIDLGRDYNVLPVETALGTALDGCFIGAGPTSEEELVLGALVLEAAMRGDQPLPRSAKKLVVEVTT